MDFYRHMTLISALEEEYKITFETDDIIDFSSFKKGIEILKKYKVEIIYLHKHKMLKLLRFFSQIFIW